MACSRKSLSAGYKYFSRRFRPSFLHIVQDDRESSASSRPVPHSPIPLGQQASAFSRPFGGFRSQSRDWRRAGFSLSLVGVDQCCGRYSSSAGESNEFGYISDVGGVLMETSVESGVAAASVSVPAPFPGEVAAAAADSFLPVAALQHLIDAVHSFTGLNWWACIAMTTVLIRGATIPLLINQLKATIKLNAMRPELEKLKEEANNNMDPLSFQENKKRMEALFKKHGVTPLTPIKGMFIQGPIFISFFSAISNMVEKVPSFKGGGAYWFIDLTTPDAMYIFPVLTALTFLATVELNMQEGMEGNPMLITMKSFLRVLAFLTVPITASFPKAIFCYWVTSNLFSLTYGFALKQSPVRKFLNLPDSIPQPNASPQSDISPSGGSKAALPAAAASSIQETGAEQANNKSPERRISSATVLKQRLRSLEKTVKGRCKPRKR